MLSYLFRAQIVVVMVAMGIHNFSRRNGLLDEAFSRAEEVNDNEVEVHLSNEDDEAIVEEDAVSTIM